MWVPGCFSAWAIKFSVSLNSCSHCLGIELDSAKTEVENKHKSAVKKKRDFFHFRIQNYFSIEQMSKFFAR